MGKDLSKTTKIRHIHSNKLFLTRTTSSHLRLLLPFGNVIQLTLLTLTPHCMTFLASHFCNITRICMYIYSFNSFFISATFCTFYSIPCPILVLLLSLAIEMASQLYNYLSIFAAVLTSRWYSTIILLIGPAHVRKHMK